MVQMNVSIQENHTCQCSEGGARRCCHELCMERVHSSQVKVKVKVKMERHLHLLSYQIERSCIGA